MPGKEAISDSARDYCYNVVHLTLAAHACPSPTPSMHDNIDITTSHRSAPSIDRSHKFRC